jgi:hypothetical protein
MFSKGLNGGDYRLQRRGLFASFTMLQSLLSMLSHLPARTKRPATPVTTARSKGLEGIALFEELVCATQSATLQVAAVASCINGLTRKGGLKNALALRNFVPHQAAVISSISRCHSEMQLERTTILELENFFADLLVAERQIDAFCDDVERLGAKQSVGLHHTALTTTWQQISERALEVVEALDPEVKRCLSGRYSENTAVLIALLKGVVDGGHPCLDARGYPYLPELAQRRPSPRRAVFHAWTLEHQGKTSRAIVRDISASGLGLDHARELTPQEVILVQFEDTRCIRGRVVWTKGTRAAVKFDAPLDSEDPLLLS